MNRLNWMLGLGVVAVIATACGGGSQQRPASGSTPAASTTAAPPSGATTGLDITLKSEPDPPKAGENTFEVMVMQGGQPVTDADVSVAFSMAAMPSMPAMRNEVHLTSAGGGIYRGSGLVMMVGRWDTTVMVMRGGQEIGKKTLAVTAK